MQILRFGLLFFFAACTSQAAVPVEISPAGFGGARQPQVAVAPGGRIHLVFGQESAVFYTASSDGGRTFSAPVKVGSLPKLALGLRRGPRLCVTDEVVAITAISHADGNLHGWSSRDGGATWQAGAQLNNRTGSAREGLHAMAGDGQGAAVAAWLDDRNGGKELWRALSTDGGITWGANECLYRSPDGHICECCQPSLAMEPGGRVAVMWRNWLGGARDLYAALSRDGGQTFGLPQKLGSGTWKFNACPMDGGSLALDPAGQPLTLWRRDHAIFASTGPGPEQRRAEAGAQPVIVRAARGVYEFWEAGGGLTLRKEDGSVTALAAGARFASAAPLPGGGVFVAWESTVRGVATVAGEAVE